jgi:hypothetical protein
LAIFVIVFFVIFLLWRAAYNAILKSYLPKNNIAVIGFNSLTEKILEETKKHPHLGFNISFIIQEKQTEQKEISGTPIFNDFKSLPELIKKKKINQIVLAGSPDSENLRSLLFECLHLKISFVDSVDFYETITGRIPIEAIGKMWFLKNLNEGGQNIADIFKKITDIGGALIVLSLTVLFWPLIALIIKNRIARPVFFRQKRVGQNAENLK